MDALWKNATMWLSTCMVLANSKQKSFLKKQIILLTTSTEDVNALQEIRMNISNLNSESTFAPAMQK